MKMPPNPVVCVFQKPNFKRRVNVIGSEQVCFPRGKFLFSSMQITLPKCTEWDHHYLAERGHYYFWPLLRDILFDKDDTSLKLNGCDKMEGKHIRGSQHLRRHARKN